MKNEYERVPCGWGSVCSSASDNGHIGNGLICVGVWRDIAFAIGVIENKAVVA
jgi:hypothetical protein